MKRIVYVQVVEMTDDEKIAMYMKHKKIDLAKMLLNANKVLDMFYKRSELERYEFDGVHQITNDMDIDGCSCSAATTYESSDYYEDDETKPGIDCAHLCHDCKDGAYCWNSECNENKNS